MMIVALEEVSETLITLRQATKLDREGIVNRRFPGEGELHLLWNLKIKEKVLYTWTESFCNS